MQLQDFITLIQNPQEVSIAQISDLTTLIARYPYFQPARTLYLKGLKNNGSFKYNQELKITAAHTTDRSVLFDFITSEAFNQNEISQQIKENLEYLKTLDINDANDISINKDVTLDDTLKQQIDATEGVLDPNLFEEKANTQPIEELETSLKTETESAPEINTSDAIEKQLQIGEPLDFTKNETHSFSEWLNITRFNPIERNPEIEEKKAEKTKIKEISSQNNFDLIDKFLIANPKIKPTKENKPTPNLAKSTEVQNDELMTETLARIYLEQKNYNKAIQSYKILSLKYPEKSGFFADQIKAVKQLQEKNNT